ncbi:hypothetical protein HN011_008062 [Eciton burchellii]|nr:hypothetical protein HN011_008062 [Eciton burchellii]
MKKKETHKRKAIEDLIEVENPNRQKKKSEKLSELIQPQKCEIVENQSDVKESAIKLITVKITI